MSSANNPFLTTNTPLAAFLLSSGAKLLTIQTADNKIVFIFEGAGNVEELKDYWEDGTATGNVKAFYKEYKNLLRIIKGNGNGQDR